MIFSRFTAFALMATFYSPMVFAFTQQNQPGIKPPLMIVTDGSWEVSGQKVGFGEYPLSAEQTPSATSPLYGGTHTATIAETNGRSKIVPGSLPIWRNRTADGEGEAYQFRKNVPLGAEPIRKITLEVNCDDVARVYINKRLVSVDKRDGKLKDGYDDWFLFRSVSGFMYDRIYTYDVTDYFFANVTNSIVVEAVSLAFDGSHAYLSAKISMEFGPMSSPPAPTPKPARSKPQPAVKPKATVEKPAAVAAMAGKEKIVFEAGCDPEIEKLHVGSILELGHVYFKADDYQLDSTSYRTLAALANFMKRHPSLKIEVGGHANLRPTERFANELSANRARSVMRYLTDNGVDAGRVTFKGYGKSQPHLKGISKEADRANQRVEVKVLEQ